MTRAPAHTRPRARDRAARQRVSRPLAPRRTRASSCRKGRVCCVDAGFDPNQLFKKISGVSPRRGKKLQLWQGHLDSNQAPEVQSLVLSRLSYGPTAKKKPTFNKFT